MVEMLPRIEVVPDDGFNSHPSDPKLMSQDTLEQFQRGETLPSTTMPTPLVCALSLCVRVNSVNSVNSVGTLQQISLTACIILVLLVPHLNVIVRFRLEPSKTTNHIRQMSVSSIARSKAFRMFQVELPLGATEDRICGTIDIEKALSEGIKAYEPGLLVRHRFWKPFIALPKPSSICVSTVIAQTWVYCQLAA
jgi:hypothetical protein